MMRQPLNSTTTSSRVLSVPTKSRLQLLGASAPKTGFHCRAGFVHGDFRVRNNWFTWTDGVFGGESALVRRTSGSALVCNARKSYGDTATLYFDGSSEGPEGRGGGGACLLRPNGNFIWRGSRYFATADSIKAEYGGLKLGLERAINAGIRYLTIYGDSDEVIGNLQGKRAINANMKGRYSKVMELTNELTKFTWEDAISRKQNSVANEFARKAMKNQRDYEEWF